MSELNTIEFRQLERILHECSRLNNECRDCPKYGRCIESWDSLTGHVITQKEEDYPEKGGEKDGTAVHN